MTGAPRVHCGPRKATQCRGPTLRNELLVYLALVEIGCFVGLVFAIDSEMQNGPAWPPLTIGPLSGLLAAHLITVWKFRRRSARSAVLAQFRGDPWALDNRWNAVGGTVRGGGRHRPRRARDWLPPCLAVAAFLSLLAVGDAIGTRWRVWLAIPAGAFLLWLLSRIVRERLIGTSRLSYARFPFFTGERAELTFGLDEGGATFQAARYTLRRYEETPHGWMSGRCRVTFESEFVPEPGILPGPENGIFLRFDIPADAGGTALSAVWPRYWELEIAGETTHGPYRVMVLVPVYERPLSGR